MSRGLKDLTGKVFHNLIVLHRSGSTRQGGSTWACRCICGVDLTISGTYMYNTASLDRIDNSKGYEEGNIQWVHKDVNFMKRTYSQEYFIKLCTLISENCSGGKCEL